jgi:hypothetical protein
MWRQKIKVHRGRRLSKEQIAIASVLAQAISNYSEDSFCAGWMHSIEHELWERIVAHKPDAYERAVKKLYAVVKKERRDWGKPSEEFLAGLKLLAQRFQVWIFYQKGETAIHLKDWLPLHEKWREHRKQQRPSLEEVWKRIHQPFPFLKPKKPVRIPPMPKQT